MVRTLERDNGKVELLNSLYPLNLEPSAVRAFQNKATAGTS